MRPSRALETLGCTGSSIAPSFIGQVTCTSTSSPFVLNFQVSPTATTPSAAHNLACVPSDAAGTLTCSEVTVNMTIPGDFNRVSVAEVDSLAAGNASGRVQR